MIPSDRQEGIVNLVLDEQGRVRCCWLVTDDEDQWREGKRQAEAILNAKESLVSFCCGGSGFARYYIARRSDADHGPDPLFARVKEALEAHAKQLSQDYMRRLEAMSPAEKRRWERDWLEKNFARYKAQCEKAFAEAVWNWPDGEWSELYQEGCKLVLEVLTADWRGRLHADLLAKIIPHESDIAAQFAILDKAAFDLQSQAQQYRPLLLEIERQSPERRFGSDWQPYANVHSAFREMLQVLERTASRILYVFQLRPRHIPPGVKWAVRARDEKKCVVCDNEKALQIDHILPFRVGGWHAADNLRLLCNACHREKDFVEQELGVNWYRARILTIPEALAYDAPVIFELRRQPGRRRTGTFFSFGKAECPEHPQHGAAHV